MRKSTASRACIGGNSDSSFVINGLYKASSDWVALLGKPRKRSSTKNGAIDPMTPASSGSTIFLSFSMAFI